MAYYDPYSSGSDSYYDPQNQSSGGETQSAMQSIKTGIVAMAGYAVTHAVVSKVVGAASKRFASSQARVATKALRQGGFSAKKTAMYQKLEGAKTGGDVLRARSSRIDKAYKSINRNQSMNAKIIGQRQAEITRLQKSRQTIDAQKHRFKSAFKDLKTFKAVAGRNITEHVIKGSVIGYGYDAATGQLESMGVKGDINPLNIVGHGVNYAKYMAKNAGMFAAMGNIGGMAKGAGSVVGGAARGFLSKNKGFTDTILENVDKLSGFNVKGAVDGRGNAIYKDAASSFIANNNKGLLNKAIAGATKAKDFATATVETMGPKMDVAMKQPFLKKPNSASHGGPAKHNNSSFNDSVMRAKDQIANSFKEKQIARKQRVSESATGFQKINMLSRSIAGTSEKALSDSEQIKNFAGLTSMLKDKSNNSNSFMQQIFGLEQTRMKDVMTTDYLTELGQGLSDKFAKGKQAQISQMLGQVRVGDDVFKAGRFNVDMNVMNPMNVMKRTLSGIGKMNFKMFDVIPMIGKNLSAGAIGMTDMLTSRDVQAFSLTSNNQGFGKVVRTADGRRTLSDVLAKDGYGVESQHRVSINYSNNKFFAIEGNKISELDTFSHIIKNGSPTVKGSNEFQKSEMSHLMAETRNSVPTKTTMDLKAIHDAKKADRHGQGFFGQMASNLDWVHVGLRQKQESIERMMNGGLTNNGRFKSVHESMYNDFLGTFAGHDAPFSKEQHRQLGRNLLDNIEPELVDIVKRPEVLSLMGRQSKKFSKGMKAAMQDEYALKDFLRNDVLTNETSDWTTLLKNDETRALINLTIQDPRSAKKHITRDRNGRYSDMSAVDSLRVKIFSAASGLADEEINPLMTNATFLRNQGVLSNSEASAMKLYGMVDSAYIDDAFKGNGTVENAALQKIYKKNKANGLNDIAEFTEYVKNNNIKSPSLIKSQTDVQMLLGDRDVTRTKVMTKDHTSFAAFGYKSDETRQWAVFNGVADVGAMRLTNLLADTVGFQRDSFKYGDGWQGALRFIGKRGGQLAGTVAAYKGIDAALAAAPMFDDTSLDAGITGALADTAASAHLLSSRVLNGTGIAGVGRYLDGLMPGFNSSAPGAIIGAGMRWGQGPLGVVGGMIRGAVGNRMLAPYSPDMTKTYDQLQKEYTGEEEVAMIKGRGWLLGTTPWQGNKVVGWKPNWYVEAKSRWKASDTLYGSEIRKLIHEPLPVLNFNIGDVLDPYYMERKHFHTRPYGETGGFLEEAPLGIGPMLSAVLGPIFKPKKKMHSEFFDGYGGGYGGSAEHSEVTAMPIPAMNEQSVFMKSAGAMNPRMGHNRSNFMGAYVYSKDKHHGQHMADRSLADLESGIGLVGFATNTARTALAGTPEVKPTVETAGRMASMSRSYNDMNLGGLGTISEAMRRFITKPDHRRVGINPIPNMLPNWLPSRFMTGDPFEKILKGELRLPGTAYERTHDINMTLPGRASMFGNSTADIVSYFTGHKSPILKEQQDILEEGTEFHEKIQNWLKAENILISAEDLFYDAKNNISGHIDGIIRDGMGGGGKRALEIKSISEKGLKKLDGPKNNHTSQLNFYLHESGMKKGSILYVSRDNPANFKVFEMDYNHSKYNKDLEKIQQARKIASGLLAQGKQGMARGFSYSWVDRMNILADVAPASKQFKEAKSIVQQQMKNGMTDDADVAKYRKALKHREATLRTHETYATRFEGKIMSPSVEYNRQNLNFNIKAAAEYSVAERIVGAAWENFTNTDTFLTNKFFAFKDPLEHYKQMQVYGKEFTPWTDPFGSFMQPRINRIQGADDPFRGAVAGAIDTGYLIGGSPMALVGGLIGAASGAANMMKGGRNWLPSHIEKERQINDYFDTMEYNKNERMANLSEGTEWDRFKNASNSTFHSLIQNESTDYTNIYRAAYDSERPYISAWLNETDKDKQQEILKIIPDRLAHVLQGHWQKSGSAINTQTFIDKTSAGEFNNTNKQQYDMRAMDPHMRTEDIKLKAINNAALNAHDFGLGWGEQMLRAQNSFNTISDVDMNADYNNASLVDPGTVKAAIMNLLIQNGLQARVRVNINDHVDGDANKISLTIQHNRLKEIRSAVDFRARFM